MPNNIALLLLSILSQDNTKFIQAKIDTIETQLVLNEVEKLIVSDVKDGLIMDSAPTTTFLEEKYPYYFDDLILESDYYSKDSITSAIVEIRVAQSKRDLSEKLINLGGSIQKLSPKEIKGQLNELHNNAIVESKLQIPESNLIKRIDSYKDFTEHSNGLSLIYKEVEHYAGKALKGTVVSILAFTGHFKSTYAIDIAYENAKLGHNILYLVLESTAKKFENDMILNHIACTAKERTELINSYLIRDKKLTPDQTKVFNKAQNDLIDVLDNHLILWDSTDIQYDSFMEMENVLRLADKQFMKDTGKGLDAVVVDQISLLKYTTGVKGSYDGAVINAWVSFFRDQALSFLGDDRQIVSFLVSQTSRNAYAEVIKEKKKGRYDASCSSDSHELERSSSTMITLYKDPGKQRTVLINIPKAREGYMPDDPLQLEVHGEYSHMGEIPCDYVGGTLTSDEFNDVGMDFGEAFAEGE